MLAPISQPATAKAHGARQDVRGRDDRQHRQRRNRRQAQRGHTATRQAAFRSPRRQPSRGPNGTSSSSAKKIGAKVSA